MTLVAAVPPSSSGPQAGERSLPVSKALTRRYLEYRLRQGRELLALIPREGRRELIRACRARTGGGESIEGLADFCADLLPLPPLAGWLADFQEHRAAHLALDDPSAVGPRSPDGSPVIVGVRELRHDDRGWVAQLLVAPRDGGWEGAIHFHSPDAATAVRTGGVFRETEVEAIRHRFDALDPSTVTAFLRSALP